MFFFLQIHNFRLQADVTDCEATMSFIIATVAADVKYAKR